MADKGKLLAGSNDTLDNFRVWFATKYLYCTDTDRIEFRPLTDKTWSVYNINWGGSGETRKLNMTVYKLKNRYQIRRNPE